MTYPKSLITSWTFWFGIIQIVFGGVGLYFGFIDQGAAYGFITTGFASIGLRLKTTQPVGSIL